MVNEATTQPENVIRRFLVTYKLFTRDSEKGLLLFEKAKTIYTSDVAADDEKAAAEHVRAMFSMCTVEVISISRLPDMTREEYESGI